MTADEWDACWDWRELFRALPVPPGGIRRVLLWVAGAAECSSTEDTDPRTIKATSALAEMADCVTPPTGRRHAFRWEANALARKAGSDSRFTNPLDVAIELVTRNDVTPNWFADVADAMDALSSVSPLVADLLKCVSGNPFRPVAFDPRWRSESAVALARTAYDTRNFSLLPILADALEEAGCDHPDVLSHCRQPDTVHVRGCWVVDGVLGKS